MQLIVDGLSNEEVMNLMFEADIDPGVTQRVFEDRTRAEELLDEVRSCLGNNQTKIRKFRSDHKVAVYDPNPPKEAPSKKESESLKIKEAIEIIREDSLKNWLAYKETGKRPEKIEPSREGATPTPYPATNLTIPMPEVAIVLFSH